MCRQNLIVNRWKIGTFVEASVSMQVLATKFRIKAHMQHGKKLHLPRVDLCPNTEGAVLDI